MKQAKYTSIPAKYSSSDNDKKIYQQIKQMEKSYFSEQKAKHADLKFWAKIFILTTTAILSMICISLINNILVVVVFYCIFGFALLLLSLNLGHDAAHNAVTGYRKRDNFLFRLCFMIHGISGYLWQIRHNNSHHVFPNVYHHDTDMDMGGLIVLSEREHLKSFHRFQHLYAPILYLFGSVILIYFQDLLMMLNKCHGNLRITKIPFAEWLMFIIAKCFHISLFILFPAYLSSAGILQIILIYFVFQSLASIFMFLTFVISHHVLEVAHIDKNEYNIIEGSWIRHQIISTIDFNASNQIANFLFGGFNLHIAHHVFPNVCHTHYPNLTRKLKDILKENNVEDWYKSYSFLQGCISHFKFLKHVARKKIDQDQLNPLNTLTIRR